MEKNLENIVYDPKSKLDKFKEGFSAIYPITALSLVSSFVSFSFCEPVGLEEGIETSFDYTTNIANGSSFFLGFSENKYKKITALSILAASYVPNILEYMASDYPFEVQQVLGVKFVGTLLSYGVGNLLGRN